MMMRMARMMIVIMVMGKRDDGDDEDKMER